MSRPVQFNTNVKVVEMPEGYSGEGFFATSFDKVIGMARKNSIWPLPFATSCCGIEFMATMAAHYDLARFGSERIGFTPRQCDLLMVMGTIAKKMGPVLRQVYLQMAEPRWVIAQVIPVDVYVPGCPPRPEAILDGVMRIQDLVGQESLRRRHSDRYKDLMNSYGIQ
ncbi:NADH-quinone oxidoreductase subunit B [Chitinophaga sp.]|uniref:NADH-quinone oxidoreductase subunit B family protein n=1 Tax=Chitinophaga sp. TaxID=1869181 RepID=UPI002FDE99C9